MLSLRPALPSDIDAILRMEQEGFDAGICWSRAQYAERLRTFGAGCWMVYAQQASDHADEAVGCVFVERWASWANQSKDDKSAWPDWDMDGPVAARHVAAGPVLYIASLTLRPATRGAGLGDPLMALTLSHAMRTLHTPAAPLREALLIVNEHWLAAQRVYLKAGFAEAGRVKDYFAEDAREPGDGVVMRRKLG